MSKSFFEDQSRFPRLWESTFGEQPNEIKIQKAENNRIIVNFNNLTPNHSSFMKMNKVTFDPIPLQVLPIGSTQLESTAFAGPWELELDTYDIRLLPFITTQFVYTSPTGPHNEGQFAIGDGLTVSSLFLRSTKLFQTEDIIEADTFDSPEARQEAKDNPIKKVTMRIGVSMDMPTLGIPDGVEISLIVLFGNPNDFV